MSSVRLKYSNEIQCSFYKQKLRFNQGLLTSTTHILNFLSDNELLNYRLTSQTSYRATQKILGQYENPIQFILGTSQYFSSKEEQKRAWQVYKKSIESDKKSSLKPALLYKSNDPLPLRFIHTEFPEGENVLENGRIYQCTPVESYTWQHNAAWLLGNIHLGRPFLLTSPFIHKFIFRQDGPYGYSAWTKEIVALSKAGYHMTNIKSNGYIIFYPTFQYDNHHKKCSIKNLNADDREIEIRLKEILHGVYQQTWGLISNKEPVLKDFEQHVLILRRGDTTLTTFWIKDEKIFNKSFSNNSVQDILTRLPPVNDSFNNAVLIECIASKYGCTLIKKDKQRFIDKQLTPSTNALKCLIM